MVSKICGRDVVKMSDLEYKILTSEESHGSYGSFGIQILVAGSNLPNLDTEQIYGAAYVAVKLIKKEVMTASLQTLPEIGDATTRNRELLDVFEEPIFVEEIPNGYCSDWCCNHLPWFIVTTRVGRIRIGYRKRVIQIDWTDTVNTKVASELFKEEDVTKEYKMIHAWSIKDAKKYIDKILKDRKDEK